MKDVTQDISYLHGERGWSALAHGRIRSAMTDGPKTKMAGISPGHL
jgi:hypothetical protein